MPRGPKRSALEVNKEKLAAVEEKLAKLEETVKALKAEKKELAAEYTMFMSLSNRILSRNKLQSDKSLYSKNEKRTGN